MYANIANMKREICRRCGGKGTVEGATTYRAKRMRAKASLRSVARLMGISAPYLSDLERGKRDWSADMVSKFEVALEQSKS
jgi:hypothetical protein